MIPIICQCNLVSIFLHKNLLQELSEPPALFCKEIHQRVRFCGLRIKFRKRFLAALSQMSVEKAQLKYMSLLQANSR